MERIEGISRGRKWMLVPAIILLVVGAFILANRQPWNWLYLVVCLVLTLAASGAARKIANQIGPFFGFFRSVVNLMLWKLAAIVIQMTYLPSADSGRSVHKKESLERAQSALSPWTDAAFEPTPPRFAETVAELGGVLLPFVVLFLIALAFPEIAD
jgi:hypothetical protein